MEIGFGEALLIIGLLLSAAAGLSGWTHGTVLSISVLAVSFGIGLAAADVISVDTDDPGLIELIELALILTLFSDGMFVERELLGRHWGPAARALVLAMPITLVLLALGAKALFPDLSWAEAFLLGAVLSPTDPVVSSTVVTAQRVPALIRHTLNLESGLNDGLALPFVLFFLVLATPGGDAGAEALELLGEAAFGALVGVALGALGGSFHHRIPGGVTAKYEGIYAVGFGLAAFGLADVTFGNGLIAAFVAGIVFAASEHRVRESFVVFSENVSSIFQVVTFFVFGALIVAIGFDGPILALAGFILFALLLARPISVLGALVGARLPRPQKAFIAWFGPKGVASMLFALFVLDANVAEGTLIFDIAAFVILSSIIAHGLTDTVGTRWIERRVLEAEEGAPSTSTRVPPDRDTVSSEDRPAGTDERRAASGGE
jgi:sodium/hydrogen antiporter